MDTKRIYIAGPLFTEGERWLLEQIDVVCKKCGYDTFLPHRDGGLFNRDDSWSSKRIFDCDIKALGECNLVVAVLNGIEVDPGVSGEVSRAHERKIPIIGYIDDSRIYAPEKQINPIVYNCLNALVDSRKDLERILRNGF